MSTAETFTSAGLWSAITRTPALSTSHIGVICAWSAVIIYASSNSIVSLLVSIGEASPVAGGRNAITYMNLLLLGSLISIIPMAVLFRRDLTRANVRTLTARNWGFLTLSALLSSAVTPGLFFYALANTSVTNIVLITRIEPPLFLLAAWFFLGEYFSRRALAAGLVALSGAVVMISLREGGGLGAIGTGEWAAVAATLAYIASTLVTRTSLRDIPIGIFSVGRTIIGLGDVFRAGLHDCRPRRLPRHLFAGAVDVDLALCRDRHRAGAGHLEHRPEACLLGRVVAGHLVFATGGDPDRHGAAW